VGIGVSIAYYVHLAHDPSSLSDQALQHTTEHNTLPIVISARSLGDRLPRLIFLS
jgi:hypothetical protein